jgi:imidazolonepropionase-like amidohydrolase
MLVIKAGLLIDGSGAEPIRDATIVIDGQRIVRVGQLREDDIPPDVQVIDASHQTVMPGLIDAHVHVRMTGDPDAVQPAYPQLTELWGTTALRSYVNARRDLEAGFTAIRDAGGRVYEDVALRDAIDDGWLEGPRMRVAGQGLSVTGGHMDRTKGLIPGVQIPGPDAVVDSPDAARRAARYQIKMGVDHIKINATLSEHVRQRGGICSPEMTFEMMEAICQVAHWAGRKVVAHCHGGEGARNAILAGVDSLEHAAWVSDEALDLMAERGTFWVPTLTVITTGFERRLEQGKPEYAKRWAERNYERVWTTFEKARARGVNIGAGTDAGVTGVPHGSNARELELMVQGGMTPMEAIVTATKANAQLLDWQADLGTIEAGKLADILVVEGNPLESVSIMRDTSNIRMVFKGGWCTQPGTGSSDRVGD